MSNLQHIIIASMMLGSQLTMMAILAVSGQFLTASVIGVLALPMIKDLESRLDEQKPD